MTAPKLPDLGALLTIYDDAATAAIGDPHIAGLRAVAIACYRAGQAEMRERAAMCCGFGDVREMVRELPIAGDDA